MIHGEHDLRDARRGHGFDESRAGADDSLVLGFRSDHEAGHVLNEKQRDALAVAAVDEIRDLLRALRVDDAAEARLLALASFDEAALVRDHADRHALDARVAADHLAREGALELVELAVVDERAEQGTHVVRHAVVGRQQIVQRLAGRCGSLDEPFPTCLCSGRRATRSRSLAMHDASSSAA